MCFLFLSSRDLYRFFGCVAKFVLFFFVLLATPTGFVLFFANCTRFLGLYCSIFIEVNVVSYCTNSQALFLRRVSFDDAECEICREHLLSKALIGYDTDDKINVHTETPADVSRSVSKLSSTFRFKN